MRGSHADRGAELVREPLFEFATLARSGSAKRIALVEGRLGQAPKLGHLFVFFSKRKDFVRILFWGANGSCTLSKRLEAG